MKNKNVSEFFENDYVKTGIESIDSSILISNGELFGVASRVTMGKEDLLQSICLTLSKRDRKIYYVSPIDGEKIFNKKMIRKIACLNERRIINGEINEAEYQQVVGAVNELQELNIVFTNDIPEDGHEPGHIFVEDINMLIYKESCASIPEKITKALVKLKLLAVKNNICVFVGLQISKKVDERSGHHACLNDLHECSNIANVCDQIAVLHRRDWYDPMDKPGMAELYTIKSKDEFAEALLYYKKDTGLFSTYASKQKVYDTEPAFKDFEY